MWEGVVRRAVFVRPRIEEAREDVPIATSSGRARTNMVCFQCVGVSQAPVVKKTSPSSLLTLCSRRLESASRGAEVK